MWYGVPSVGDDLALGDRPSSQLELCCDWDDYGFDWVPNHKKRIINMNEQFQQKTYASVDEAVKHLKAQQDKAELRAAVKERLHAESMKNTAMLVACVVGGLLWVVAVWAIVKVVA